MSSLTVNGFPCVRGRITLPLTGVWVADVVADPEDSSGSFPPPGQSVTLSFLGVSFKGTVRRGSAPYGTTFARLVGGAGGLPTGLPAKSYQSTTIGQVLSDLLEACGETLSELSDQSLLGTNLSSWVRIAAPGWQALAVLMEAVNPDGTWRVLQDGTVWVGTDQWPDTSLQTFELLSYLPQEIRAEIYSDSPTVLPGQSLLGGKATSIDHVIEPAKIFTTVLFLDSQLQSVEVNGV